ncbi:major outer membrane protein [Aliarcobacter cryaerophilus]|uniref:major outer membrane protein n=1 Tax=Aliarcobacter cryaerophilus TaxID=28198 RepID=UPI003DA584C4
MRKISKLSLVAAVAVSGLSFANAQPLEEAIKNVDVSGSVVYRYDNFGGGDNLRDSRTDANRYKIGLNLSSKVNDYVKFNSRFIVGSQANGGFASLDAKKDTGTDGQADVSLSNAYFGFTAIPNTVVNVGKQGLATPYTVAVDINGNEQTGTGILALTNFSVVTLGAGYFNNTNLGNSTELNSGLALGVGQGGLAGGADMYVATAQADLDFVKLEAWYAGMQDTFNSYTLAATSNIDLAENAKIGLEARWVYLGWENEAKDTVATAYNRAFDYLKDVNPGFTGADIDKKNSMFRLAVDGKFSIVNARVAYTKTDKNGGITALDQDAKNTSLGWGITSNAVADADYWQAALGADILDNLNFTVHYGNIKGFDGDYKANETYGQLTYKMSKNLNTYLRYGTLEQKVDGDKILDQNRGRIQVAYTF